MFLPTFVLMTIFFLIVLILEFLLVFSVMIIYDY